MFKDYLYYVTNVIRHITTNTSNKGHDCLYCVNFYRLFWVFFFIYASTLLTETAMLILIIHFRMCVFAVMCRIIIIVSNSTNATY